MKVFLSLNTATAAAYLCVQLTCPGQAIVSIVSKMMAQAHCGRT